MSNENDTKILEQFINENDLEQLESISSKFNIFTALDIVREEKTHSNFLRWLMSPQGNHEMSDYFLKLFLKKVVSLSQTKTITLFDVDLLDMDDVEVEREWKGIDILVKDNDNKLICAIENKIDSGEGQGQLKRYMEKVESEFHGYNKFFVYLSIDGEPPSEDAYVRLKYVDIVYLIEKLLDRKSDKMSSEIVDFIDDYKEMLRRYIVENSPVQQICKKIYKQHKEAIDLIDQYKPDKQLEIKDYLVSAIGKYPDLILDDSNKIYIRFISKNLDFIPHQGERWTKSARILLFEIRNYKDRTDLYIVIGPGPKEIRERLHELLVENADIFTKVPKLSPEWCGIKVADILKKDETEDKEIDEIGITIDKKIQKFKSEELPKIVSVFEKFK